MQKTRKNTERGMAERLAGEPKRHGRSKGGVPRGRIARRLAPCSSSSMQFESAFAATLMIAAMLETCDPLPRSTLATDDRFLAPKLFSRVSARFRDAPVKMKGRREARVGARALRRKEERVARRQRVDFPVSRVKIGWMERARRARCGAKGHVGREARGNRVRREEGGKEGARDEEEEEGKEEGARKRGGRGRRA